MSQKITADHESVKAKILAGLPPADALEVAQRQADHDETLAASDAAAAKAKAPAKKSPKAGDE